MSSGALPPRLGLDPLAKLRRELITPEGMPLRFVIASAGDRVAAFFIDVIVMLIGFVLLLVGAGLLGQIAEPLAIIVLLLGMFALRMFYFIGLELRWRGRTIGKRCVGLRVVDARGGQLTAEAIVARNFTREIELWLPIVVLLVPDALFSDAGWVPIVLSWVWLIVIAGMPLFNRDRRRVGDLIGGTLVVREPRRYLAKDVVASAQRGADKAGGTYAFTEAQLGHYGVYELQVLEEVLRGRSAASQSGRDSICRKIRNKIEWPSSASEVHVDRFLEDFYVAQRAYLEQRMQFGERKEHKHDRGDGGRRRRS